MCCRGFVNFIIRCQIAIYQGCIEFWQKGCIIGSQYLVKPNYHSCERRLWFGIFIVCSSLGFTLILYYMNNYSENVFRTVIEDHGHHLQFNYPTLGICEMGVRDDKQTLARVQDVLNGSIYKQFPVLSSNDKLKHFVHMMAFQNLNRDGRPIREFIKYTQTLAPDVRAFLESYDYRTLVDKITTKCEDFFDQCIWLNDEIFECCEAFREVSTMLGKCFLFNSDQTDNTKPAALVKQIEIYKEPYRLYVASTKAARIFLLNPQDIPETIAPLRRYQLDEKGVTLSLEFNAVPTINDEGLVDLGPKVLRCIKSGTKLTQDKAYLFYSYTACITEKLYEKQINLCNCTNLYAPLTRESKFCNLTQYVCLEENGFINTRFMHSRNTSLIGQCLPNCEDAEYVVENVYYSKSSDETVQNLFILDFVFLNFPKIHRRRQAIRQVEDKIAAFSGILGLFMGLCVVSIIEFIYLTCCAFWQYQPIRIPQSAAAAPATIRVRKGTRNDRSTRGTSSQIVFQP